MAIATVYVNVAIEVEVPDEDMEAYDDNATQWATENVSIDVEAPNFDWWIDNAEMY